MSAKATAAIDKSQSDKFKNAAREHGADEDEQRWEDRLKKVARQKPETNPPHPKTS